MLSNLKSLLQGVHYYPSATTIHIRISEVAINLNLNLGTEDSKPSLLLKLLKGFFLIQESIGVSLCHLRFKILSESIFGNLENLYVNTALPHSLLL